MASSVKYTKSDANSKFYKPMDDGDGLIDVVNDMPWTLSPISSRKDVPYIELTEYQQTTGQLIASLIYYARVLDKVSSTNLKTVLEPDDPEEVYRYKYFAEPTGFRYRLPYFNPKKMTRGNTFGSEESPFASLLKFGSQAAGYGGKGFLSLLGKSSEVAGAGIGLVNTSLPGAINFESPQSWTGTSPETVEVTFDLFNTDSVEDVYRNRRFCHLLSYQNTPSRRNFAIVDPPTIYSLFIPDVVQFPACYVSTLNITNLGNTRLMDLGGTARTIPEAYRIEITFTSLLMPTRNIMRALEKGRKVEAISDIAPFNEDLKAVDAVQNGTATIEQQIRFSELAAKAGDLTPKQSLAEYGTLYGK
jgi:hypothetical protein